MTADGHGTMAIRAATGKAKPTIWRWQARYMATGFASLFKDAPRGRGKPKLADAMIRRAVETTLHQTPPNATHWSRRGLGRHIGIGHTSVQRIWHAHGLKPHKVETFKLSNDPRFVDKVRDIVGLYINPPEHALVLSVDEKSQIQALDRTQPGLPARSRSGFASAKAGLPMKKGRAATMTHDCKRNGTTTLFAALNVAGGKVIGQCMLRHRAAEFVRFLRTIDKATPPACAKPGRLRFGEGRPARPAARRRWAAGRELHLIQDNYATHLPSPERLRAGR